MRDALHGATQPWEGARRTLAAGNYSAPLYAVYHDPIWLSDSAKAFVIGCRARFGAFLLDKVAEGCYLNPTARIKSIK